MLREGAKAPAFCLPAAEQDRVCLSDFTGKWVVLYFYPKDNTSGCTTEACEFTAGIEAFSGLRATVLGVSPDSPRSHRNFADKHGLKLTLLADPERSTMARYGAYGTKKMYGKEVQGVIRSTFLIDPEGNLAWSWINVKAAGHAAEVQQKLEQLAGHKSE